MKKGFTLIELLIVITIIGILAVAFLPSILNAPSKARDSQRIATVNDIVEKITVKDLSATPFNMNASNAWCVGTAIAGGAPIVAGDFEQGLPKDPGSKNVYTNACTSGYWVLKATAASTYRYLVVARVENAASVGNYACPATPAAAPAAAVNPVFVNPPTAATNCYAIGIK